MVFKISLSPTPFHNESLEMGSGGRDEVPYQLSRRLDLCFPLQNLHQWDSTRTAGNAAGDLLKLVGLPVIMTG